MGNHVWIRMGMLWVCVAASLVGCASSPQSSGAGVAAAPSAAEKRYEQESSWLGNALGRTDVQGAIVGAALGGIVCALSQASTNDCVGLTAAGATVGYVGGAALNSNRQTAAGHEMTLDQTITAMHQDNENTKRMIVAQQDVVDEKVIELERIRQSYGKKTLALADAKRQLAAVEKTKANLAAKTNGLRELEKQWTADNQSLNNSQISGEIADLKGKIKSADDTLDVLARSINETQRTLTAAG